MKTKARNKKVWEKPVIDLMKINRDTFSGSGEMGENKNNPSKRSNP